MRVEGITWHALTLEAEEFGATKKLLIEVFGLTPVIDTDSGTTFPMSNGTILELYAPAAIPAYGFNDGGIVFGFRVEDIEAASEKLAEDGCELLGEYHSQRGEELRLSRLQGPRRTRLRDQRAEVAPGRSSSTVR